MLLYFLRMVTKSQGYAIIAVGIFIILASHHLETIAKKNEGYTPRP